MDPKSLVSHGAAGLGTWAGSAPFRMGSSTLCPNICHSVWCPGVQSMEQRDPPSWPFLVTDGPQVPCTEVTTYVGPLSSMLVGQAPCSCPVPGMSELPEVYQAC